MKLLIVTVISISAGLFAIYFALFVKAQATVLLDTMNIQRLDFASGLSHQDILIKYLESFVELSTKPLQPVNDDVDFATKVGKHALKPLEVEVRVIILNYFCGLILLTAKLHVCEGSSCPCSKIGHTCWQ